MRPTRCGGLVGPGAAIAALALVRAGCEGDLLVRPAVTVEIAPENPTVQVNGTVQLTATVRGSADGRVTWTSGADAIATVDASTGVVTGVAEGQAVIRATSVADPSAFDTTTVTVEPPASGVLLIRTITDAETGQEVDRTQISGTIVVSVEYEAPPGVAVSHLDILVDDAVQCTHQLGEEPAAGGAAALAVFDCTIATDAVDDDGAPLFADGPHTIYARVMDPDGALVAEAGEPVTFSNEGG